MILQIIVSVAALVMAGLRIISISEQNRELEAKNKSLVRSLRWAANDLIEHEKREAEWLLVQQRSLGGTL